MLVAVIALAGLIHAEPDVSGEDLDRFPCREVVQEMSALADRRRDWIDVQRQFHPGHAAAWNALYEDACWRAQCWDRLYWAHAHREHTRCYAHESLGQLRDSIGYENYYSGSMPCPVNLDHYEVE